MIEDETMMFLGGKATKHNVFPAPYPLDENERKSWLAVEE
jgi:hypothetical protein